MPDPTHTPAPPREDLPRCNEDTHYWPSHKPGDGPKVGAPCKCGGRQWRTKSGISTMTTNSTPAPPPIGRLVDELRDAQGRYTTEVCFDAWRKPVDEAVLLRLSSAVAEKHRALLEAIEEGRKDGERLDWLEEHGFAALCWNVSTVPEHEHWRLSHEPPNNGWTIGSDSEDDIGKGATLREAIDAARAQPDEP